MSASSIHRAANDMQLQARVLALASKEAVYNEELGATVYGQQLLAGATSAMPLMWPIAVNSEAEYESALAAGRGSPGHDVDVITDAALSAAIVANWPPDPETP